MNTILIQKADQQVASKARVHTMNACINDKIIATFTSRIISNSILKCHGFNLKETAYANDLVATVINYAKQSDYKKLSICIEEGSAFNLDEEFLMDEFESEGEVYKLFLMPVWAR
jgi:hypothetical protein